MIFKPLSIRFRPAKETAQEIFPRYHEHVDAALEIFCGRHWPCEPGGEARCVNVRSGVSLILVTQEETVVDSKSNDSDSMDPKAISLRTVKSWRQGTIFRPLRSNLIKKAFNGMSTLIFKSCLRHFARGSRKTESSRRRLQQISTRTM